MWNQNTEFREVNLNNFQLSQIPNSQARAIGSADYRWHQGVSGHLLVMLGISDTNLDLLILLDPVKQLRSVTNIDIQFPPIQCFVDLEK